MSSTSLHLGPTLLLPSLLGSSHLGAREAEWRNITSGEGMPNGYSRKRPGGQEAAVEVYFFT